MSYRAKNYGELFTSDLACYTIGQKDWRQIVSMNDYCLNTENYFHFHSPNDKLDVTLIYLKSNEDYEPRMGCSLTLRDLENRTMKTWSGDIELSEETPREYLNFVFQYVCSLIHGSRCTGGTATVEGDDTFMNPFVSFERLNEIAKELAVEPPWQRKSV